MPTYQYACTACDERLEAVQSFTAAPLAECPACGGALRKVFSAVGVVFKGSGFYKTDSRAKPSKAKESKSGVDASTSTSSGESKTSSSSGGSSESKPASSTPAPATPASKTA